MNRIWAAAVVGLAVVAAQPARANWMWHRHDHFGWGPPPMAYGPPVIVYPASPPVVMVAPPAAGYVAQPAPVQAIPVSPPFSDTAGHYCREYQTTVMVGGKPQQSYGTACQQPDGTWRLMN